MAAKKKKAAAPKQQEQKLDADAYIKGLAARSSKDESIDFVAADDEFAGLQDVNEWISTGSLELDRQLGGGWPVTRIVEVAAWESVGKSTLLDQSIAMAQRAGGIAALIDSEKARDRQYSVRLGVDLKKLIISSIDTVEDGFKAIDMVLDQQEAFYESGNGAIPPPLFIVWDSLGGTPSRAELEGAADDKHMTQHARTIKQNFRRITIRLGKLRGCLVFTNQFYQNIGGYGGVTTTGGGGVRYYPSLRVWLYRGDPIKVGEKKIGHKVQSKVRKTRITVPPEPVDIGLIYGAGFDNAWTLFEWCKKSGPEGTKQGKRRWIETRGAWHFFTHPETGEVQNFQRGFLGFGEILAADPDIYRSLATFFMNPHLLGD